jgi:MoxR-like ATPase
LFLEWQSEISNVKVGKEILNLLTEIRKGLKSLCKDEDINPLDYYISDRRWKKIVHLLQTSAFLNDREYVDHSDILLLHHMLWNKTDTISKVTEIISIALLSDIVKKKDLFEKKLEKYLKTFNKNKDIDFRVFDNFYYKLKNFPQGACYFHLYEYKHLSLTTDCEGVLYYDDIKNLYYVRKFDASNPGPGALFGNVERVKIRRHPNGICINGELYVFRAANSENEDIVSEDYVTKTFDELLKELGTMEDLIKNRKKIVCNSTNIFIRNFDFYVLKGHIKSLEKKVNGLGVKIRGYSLSL